MKRREFIRLLGGAGVWPLAAHSQQPTRMPLIGMLFPVVDDQQTQSRILAFRSALLKMGWVDGRNIQIEYRFASGGPDDISRAAVELIAMAPDVIVASGTPAVAVLHRQTRTIPIVFAQVADPVSQGFVRSLAHPGGNITGFTVFEFSIGGKWLELLKAISPNVSRVAFIHNPKDPLLRNFLPAIEPLAISLDIHFARVDAENITELEGAISTFAQQPNGGLIIPPTPIIINHQEQVVTLAAQYGLPAIYPYRYFVISGGLLSYGTNNVDLFQQAASYVDRIFKGAKPSDLPVQLPTKFELVINLKAAKALGLTVPPQLLARTDEVIE